MVIVPTFALGENIRPPEITGVVIDMAGTVAPHVSDRVNKFGRGNGEDEYPF